MARHLPTLLGALFIGVLSSLPVVDICCCLWVVSGGLLVAYLQQQNTLEPIETASAALAGAIAGALGAVIVALSHVVMSSVSEPFFMRIVDDMRSQLGPDGPFPAAIRENAARLVDSLTPVKYALIRLAVNLPMFTAFSVLGALLGVAVFRKKTPPPAPQG